MFYHSAYVRTSPWDYKGEFVSAGISDLGDGWWRCTLTHNGYMVSMNTKMVTTPMVRMDADTGYAYFDLETGDVYPGRGMLSAWEGPPKIDTSPYPFWEDTEVFIHGVQLVETQL